MTNNLAIYIHWPFCKSKCPYCDFNSHVSDKVKPEDWQQAYINEINKNIDLIQNKKITSIFFGGGTPSLMPPQIAYSIINRISMIAQVDIDTEITLESNPTSVEADKFISFREAGINRVSLGIQSLDDKALKFLGREHDSKEAIIAIECAAKHFSNYSFDLIYALPKQTISNWQNQLEIALSLAKNHLSLYQLTIEKGTKFFSLHKHGQIKMPEDDLACEMFKLTNEIMIDKEFQRYEVSNHARDGYECKHNLTYWNYGEYLGIGPGAHSRIFADHEYNALTSWYSPYKWLDLALNSKSTLQSKNTLTKREIVEEAMLMGLRLKTGITEKRAFSLTGLKFKDFLNLNNLNKLTPNLVTFDGESIKATENGLLILNQIIYKLLEQ